MDLKDFKVSYAHPVTNIYDFVGSLTLSTGQTVGLGL